MVVQRNNNGFTLLEMLVAISVFSLIGIASFRLLTTVTGSQRFLDERSTRLVELQRTFRYLGDDISQFIYRDIREGRSATRPALLVGYEPYIIEISRTGWSNPLGRKRSTLQRVAYQFNEAGNQFETAALSRIYWPVLDRPEGMEPVTQQLLTRVEELEIRVQDTSDQWHSTWPPTPADQENAQAIEAQALEISFTHSSLGTLTRVFPLL
jgi:general secretion pathway protein J